MIRRFLVPALLGLGLTACTDPAAGQLATGHAKFLGNVYSSAQIPDFEKYWNQVTPENAGKWGSVEANRDQMNWSELDAAYDFAKTNGFPIRYHVLIWGNQQPAWIESLPPSEQLEEIEEWFAAVAARYPDLDYVEVVNEPLHDPPNSTGSGGGNYINALGGSGSSGWEWVLRSFRLARSHFPNAKLLINDYGIVGSISDTNRYKGLISLLQAENLIDGIGVQAHAFTTVSAHATVMRNSLNILATTGLPIQVTELDIDGSSDAVQWREYERVLPVFWEHPAVIGVTLWGWRIGMWRTAEKAYLVNQDGSERFALSFWMRPYLNGILADVEPAGERPHEYRLLGSYPNPFNPQTTITYELEKPGPVRVDIYDLTGRRVRTLVDDYQSASVHETQWNGLDEGGNPVPSGVYVSRLVVGDASVTGRLVLNK